MGNPNIIFLKFEQNINVYNYKHNISNLIISQNLNINQHNNTIYIAFTSEIEMNEWLNCLKKIKEKYCNENNIKMTTKCIQIIPPHIIDDDDDEKLSPTNDETEYSKE